MTICNPCIKTKTLPNCLAQLTIGTIVLISQAVKVYIQDISTGALMILDGSADSDGLVTLEIPDTVSFFDNHAYELWITDLAAGVQDTETITVGESTGEFVCLRFQTVRDENGSAESYLTQIITEA